MTAFGTEISGKADAATRRNDPAAPEPAPEASPEAWARPRGLTTGATDERLHVRLAKRPRQIQDSQSFQSGWLNSIRARAYFQMPYFW